ncbi:MAG: hypothetical protein GY947_01885 [Rhodobacteraceae bacterium]|nr:hypothetical protein [Paracoccaceae bacterium]
MTKSKPALPQPVKPDNPGAEMRIALALTLVWLLACSLYLGFVPGALEYATRDMLGIVFLAVAVGFPLVLIWTVSFVTGSIRSIRAEALILRQSMDQIKSVIEDKPESPGDREERVQQQLDEIASLTQQTDHRLTELAAKTFAETGEPPAPRNTAALGAKNDTQPDIHQTALPLQTPDGPARVPISVIEFLKALNFPDNADDREGFRVLRRAFEERQLGKLLQASQDVLTLLSQDGIYMDDLTPDKPLPSVWRKFSRGERGLSITALGGIRDRSALTLTKTRLKRDPIFRDATHHFLRQFDKILVEFEPLAEDTELLQMSETRTARAFMLLGRVAGSFD